MLSEELAYTDDDLVAVGDHLVCRSNLRSDGRHPVATPGEAIAWADGLSGRNCRRMRRVARSVRDGAQSPMETLLRLLLVHAGLPEPELNVNIFDATGTFIARGDMVYPECRVIVEFDGDQHRTSRAQYSRDRERLRALREAGCHVEQADFAILINPERARRFVQRVRQVLLRRSV
ncbi:endonuclease domain-containing protein [Pseudoclavibacter sp. 13-3]|uniref:endonuclease domain-containing protein n=1 Tax=Pseudoclavibacter sp. 13-3 TaxID=2901228 RepID=UPI001E56EF0D|nr:endonuclease domain-containing protein [Pseudoclavibacter sp. 13-3]MCD7101071.1 endonuclease domain-containing protein [Pseudoclavibacter sp. 13-3]